MAGATQEWVSVQCYTLPGTTNVGNVVPVPSGVSAREAFRVH
jgi:hypothetical protein